MSTINSSIASEILALTVVHLFPGSQLIDGRSDSFTFFYDFLIEQPIDENALPLLEEEIRRVIKNDVPIECLDMMRENAAQLFMHHGQSFKANAIMQFDSNIVQTLRMGKFYDFTLQDFPSGLSTSLAGAVKLISITPIERFIQEAGQLSLIRISGITAKDKQALKKGFKIYEAAKMNVPHRLGLEMELFATSSFSGSVTWAPKGMILKDTLTYLWKTGADDLGFQFISTPCIIENKGNQTPYIFEMEDQDLCPLPDKASQGAAFIATQNIDTKELPIKLAEIAEQFDPIQDIELVALLRSRLYTADSLQIYCTSKQIVQELISSLQFFDKTFRILDFECHWTLIANRSQASKGTPAEWKHLAAWLTQALDTVGVRFSHEKRPSTLSVPRIELRLRDSLEREWATSWLEINTLYPRLFDLHTQDEGSSTDRLCMINGSLFGSLERIAALLIERCGGRLPLWLAPEQVRLLPMGERHIERARLMSQLMKNSGFRVGIDPKNLPLGSKIHAAEKARIPYIVILGDREQREDNITVRPGNENSTANVKLEELLIRMNSELGRQNVS